MCTIIEGTGEAIPDETVVTYQHTSFFMDGTKFDSSRDTPTPSTAKLGHGHLLKCLDEGMKKMRKGEKAIFVCPPETAYGKKGNAVIPPNTSMVFEIEIIDFELNVEGWEL